MRAGPLERGCQAGGDNGSGLEGRVDRDDRWLILTDVFNQSVDNESLLRLPYSTVRLKKGGCC